MGTIVDWTSKETGSNRPQNVCPLSIYPEKEGKEVLVNFVPIVEEEIKEIMKDGVEIEIDNVKTISECINSEMSMID